MIYEEVHGNAVVDIFKKFSTWRKRHFGLMQPVYVHIFFLFLHPLCLTASILLWSISSSLLLPAIDLKVLPIDKGFCEAKMLNLLCAFNASTTFPETSSLLINNNYPFLFLSSKSNWNWVILLVLLVWFAWFFFVVVSKSVWKVLAISNISQFFLIPKIKRTLKGHRFTSIDEFTNTLLSEL